MPWTLLAEYESETMDRITSKGLKLCLEVELLPNIAKRVLKEKVSKGDEPKEEHVTYNRLKAVDTNASVILNLVAGSFLS